MAKDFFDGLGESLAKTMREIGEKAESIYSEQRLKGKISGEEKQIQKIMEELGKILYRRYRDGVPLEDMQKRLCEQIDQRMERISQYKEQIAGVKARKICPSCGASVEIGMAFCPHCGAFCTTKEPETAAGEVVAEGTFKEAEVKETPEETAEKAEAEETQEEAAEKAEAEEILEETAEEAEAEENQAETAEKAE